MAPTRNNITHLFIPRRLKPSLTRSFKDPQTGMHQQLSNPNSLAVWRDTPDSILIQIRREVDFIAVHISEGEATQLRDALTQFIGELADMRTRDQGGD
jgi:hypothetical protein